MMHEIITARRAIGWSASGSEFLRLYEAAAKEAPDDWELTSAKLQTLGHALECAMKGWLVLMEGADFTDSKVRAKYAGNSGHDLSRLARAAGQHYPVLLKNLRPIDHLNSSYWGGGKRDYEYPVGNKNIAFVPASELVQLIRPCLMQLSAEIQRVIQSP